MKRAYNFNAGPAALPLEVLQEAQAELLDFQGTGMSVMELSHRSKEYEAVHEEAGRLLRVLLNVPDDYSILFLQGGASLQFYMVPLNLWARSDCQLRPDRFLVGKGFRGGSKGRPDQDRGQHRGGAVPAHPPPGGTGDQRGRSLRAYHVEQHHLRHPVAAVSGHQRRALGCRHVQ